MSCQRCRCEPCQCHRAGWAKRLSPETHARGEMVRRVLPWGHALTIDGGDGLARRDAEIARLAALEPKLNLKPDELLELYLLELIEALKSERAKNGNLKQ